MAPPEAQAVAQIPAATPKRVYAKFGTAELTGSAVADLNDYHYATAKLVTIPPVDPTIDATLKHTTMGVNAEPYTIVDGPQYWKAADYTGKENAHKWQWHLTAEDIAELDAALASIEAKGIKIEDLKKEDFPLPTLGPKLLKLREEVVHGKGFHVLKGFPTERYSRWQTIAAYFAIGLYLGNPQAQNAKGHIVGHIKAIGTDPRADGVRPYTTNIAHGYHNDNSDIVALLCLKEAKEGGISNWTSSVSIHNELLRRGRKDLVEVLTKGTFYIPAHNVWGNPNDKFVASGPDATMVNFPVFHYHDNFLTTNYNEGVYYYHYKFPEAPRMTPLEEEALRTFTALAMSDELRLDYKMQPGDIAFVHNLTMLHAKTAFVDYDTPAEKRHLLRLWVATPDSRPLHHPYEVKWGSTQVGSRGGYWLGHHYTRTVPLEAEFGDLEVNRPKAQ